MLALLSQAAQAATGQAVLGGAPLWHPQALAGFVGISGAYDLEGLAQHLHKRGLYKNLLDTIMSIDGQVQAFGFIASCLGAGAAALLNALAIGCVLMTSSDVFVVNFQLVGVSPHRC